jgi:transcriptional regulator with XRE-family HTH domain
MGTNEADQFNVTVGGLLRAEAAMQRISVSKLSTLSGIERNTLTRYLNGERAIPIPVLYRVSETLGVSPESIVTAATARMSGQ